MAVAPTAVGAPRTPCVVAKRAPTGPRSTHRSCSRTTSNRLTARSATAGLVVGVCGVGGSFHFVSIPSVVGPWGSLDHFLPFWLSCIRLLSLLRGIRLFDSPCVAGWRASSPWPTGASPRTSSSDGPAPLDLGLRRQPRSPRHRGSERRPTPAGSPRTDDLRRPRPPIRHEAGIASVSGDTDPNWIHDGIARKITE